MLAPMTGELQIGDTASRSDPSWHHRISLLRPLPERRSSVCYILGVKTWLSTLELCILCILCVCVCVCVCVSFG